MKPVVKFSSLVSVPTVGRSCLLYPVNHPSSLVSNGGSLAQTSKVVKVRSFEEFETENTLYIRGDA